ncbi:methyltransferase domain-containing protein [Sphingomonas sp. RG327]|uniref:Methyltransferase domain-containing protein n=1 Tax=Sphingomonas anseongensis TaxID=2908207 RepID=A0ABT0RF14_9SPHN|nr:methyltransferase domain-containing protein [Sphingomonas anseongensis]MCL6678877.1 methyltransferase domain-containing protein [Sphingomonas anseongensis]
MNRRAAAALLAASALLASCRAEPQHDEFPKPHRPVASIVADTFSTEDVRDRMGEFERVVELAGVKPGMWVADVGAGEGYYAVRLSPVVGRRGRVLAEDIVPQVRDRLAQRVQRENLDNVAVSLGDPDDPKLPAHSLDRVFLIHMYHEVDSPYAFLWHVREALKPGGLIIVVDADRPPQRHGLAPTQLRCEFAALGLKLRAFQPVDNGDAYFASFEPVGERPAPGEIKPCKG